VYQKKIDKLGKNIHLKSLATPLLVPMIEEGFFNHSISKNIINGYLSDKRIHDIDALILGCTHFPLIKKEIEEFYDDKVTVIDTSHIVAAHLKEYLQTHGLMNDGKKNGNKFFVSDYTHSFAESTKIFFQEEVKLEHYPLWD
jgi:glutamate racemase